MEELKEILRNINNKLDLATISAYAFEIKGEHNERVGKHLLACILDCRRYIHEAETITREIIRGEKS